MERYRKLLSILFISTIVSTAFADAPADWFATLGLGVGLNTKPSATSVNNGSPLPDQYEVSSIDNAAIANIGFGKELLLNSKYFSHYRFSVNYNMTTPYRVTGIIDQYGLPGHENYNYTYNINSKTLLFAYEGDIITYKQWSPHVELAIGTSQNSAVSYSESVIGNVRPRTFAGFSDHSQYAFAYQVGLGINYQIFNHSSVNLDYEYLNAGQARLGTDASGNQGAKQTLASQDIMLSFKHNFAL